MIYFNMFIWKHWYLIILDLVYEEILLFHYPNFRKSYYDKLAKGESVCSHIVNNANKNVVRKK
jgi:hypothetical protein